MNFFTKLAILFMCVSAFTCIYLSSSCKGRSIRVKRQSGAMWQLHRRRRNLMETYKRLEIIYNRISSNDMAKYTATSSSIARGPHGVPVQKNVLSVISSIMGPDFPVGPRHKPSAHSRQMAQSVEESFTPKPGLRQRIEVSKENTYNTDGFVVKYDVNAGHVNGSRRHIQNRTVAEVVHLCGQINNKLKDISVILRCETFRPKSHRYEHIGV